MHRIIGEIAYDEGRTVAVTFDRFLSWVIYGFSSKSLQRMTFSANEAEKFTVLLGMLAQATNEAIRRKGGRFSTSDQLSELYETHIIGAGEKDRNAQYHTPDHVATLCASIAMAQDGHNRIYEPCCGSGRMFLAACEKHPGTPVLGEELDPVSARMATCNLLLNGIEGEIVCRDVLMRDRPPKFAYRINEGIRNPASIWYGIPHIEQLA